jgi:hypothetical protein
VQNRSCSLADRGSIVTSFAVRFFLLAVSFALVSSCRSSCGASGVTSATASAGASSLPHGGPLPPASRVFSFRLGTNSIVLGGSNSDLWCADAANRVLWNVHAPGPLQLAAAGDFGRGEHAYAAFGANERKSVTDMIVDEIDVGSGELREMWRTRTPRNEAVHLEVTDPEGDGRRGLTLAYFTDKYMVQSVWIGSDLAATTRGAIRMGTSRAFADVDGDGVTDEIIGRLYGDTALESGGLRVRTAKGTFDVTTDRGVRAIAVIASGNTQASDILFSDGWEADYGHKARAELERGHWTGSGFDVRRVATSAEEYAFFDVLPVPTAPNEALVVGDKRISLYRIDSDGSGSALATRPWSVLPGPGSVAVTPTNSGPMVYLTGKDATHTVSLLHLGETIEQSE